MTRAMVLVGLVAILAESLPAGGAEPVGSVAALEGRAEVLRAGAADWVAVAVGDGVLLGDQLRTLADGKLRIVFGEDSELTMAADSRLTVDEQVTAPAPASRFSLLVGTVKAIVGARYAEPGARFDLETPTAVAGVRGTGFIASYEAAADETTVVGLLDVTRVRARIDPQGLREVTLGPGAVTKVGRGSYPIRPTLMPEGALRALGAATDLPVPVAPPGKKLTPSSGGKRDGKEPRLPRRPDSAAPEGGVVDQPIDLLKERARRGVPPPPPPVPRSGR